MRQGTLTRDLRVSRGLRSPGGTQAMIAILLEAEPELAFHGVVPCGSVLKSIAELLMRCAAHVPVTVDANGLSFVACDAVSGRLVHVVLDAADLGNFRFLRDHPLRCTLESASLNADPGRCPSRPGTRPPTFPPAEAKRQCPVVRHGRRAVRKHGRLFRTAATHEALHHWGASPRAGWR